MAKPPSGPAEKVRMPSPGRGRSPGARPPGRFAPMGRARSGRWPRGAGWWCGAPAGAAPPWGGSHDRRGRGGAGEGSWALWLATASATVWLPSSFARGTRVCGHFRASVEADAWQPAGPASGRRRWPRVGVGAGGLRSVLFWRLGGCLGALAHGGANGEPRDSASAAGAGSAQSWAPPGWGGLGRHVGPSRRGVTV